MSAYDKKDYVSALCMDLENALHDLIDNGKNDDDECRCIAIIAEIETFLDENA